MQRDKLYLLERQRNLARLKRTAIEEFIQARNSGRLVAFVGSYASENLGYANWDEFVSDFLDGCEIDPSRVALFKRLRRRLAKSERQFENTDHMDLAELLAGRDRHADEAAFLQDRQAIARQFELTGKVADAQVRPSVASALFDHLKVARAVTLNYDLELEWSMFLTAQDLRAEGGGVQRAELWDEILKKCDTEAPQTSSGHPGFVIERQVPGRGKVVSDVLAREDSAQLIEFAIGTPDEERGRILHLHGRVDHPESMLVTRRDYRDRYWQDDFSRLPFEYGQRLIFTGNPILYVGIGMAEAEVTRTLEQMLSNNPNRRAVPMFLLWNSSGRSDESRDDDDVTRLLFNRKFGVHVLFDHEIAELTIGMAEYQGLIGRGLATGAGKARDMPDDAGLLLRARRLEEPLRLLSALADADRLEEFWAERDFRNPQAKYEASSKHRVNVWCYDNPGRAPGAPSDAEAHLVREARSSSPGAPPDVPEKRSAAAGDFLAERLRGGSAIKSFIGAPASRRGAIASCLGDAFERLYKKEARDGRVVVVNGSFATDTDSIFSILSGAFDGETAWAARISRANAMERLKEQIGRQLERGMGKALVKLRDACRAALEEKSEQIANFSDADRQDLEAAQRILEKWAEKVGTTPEIARQRELTLIINGMERFFAHDGSALSAELDALIRLVILAEQRYQREQPHLLEGALDAYDRMRKVLLKHQIHLPDQPALPPFPVRLILIGTSRLARYLSVVAPGHQEIGIRISAGREKSSFTLGDEVFSLDSGTYFAKLQTKFPAAPPPVGAEASGRRRSYLAGVFDSLATDPTVANPELAFEILRALAFIGQPTERHVLYHVPNLRPAAKLTGKCCRAIDGALEALVERGLVLHIVAFPGGSVPRFALHKTVVTEMRQRYGVPVSDARLAAGFNMGLFTAQPLDIYTPEQRWHAEIGRMVDFLAGQYRDDQPIEDALRVAAQAASRRAGKSGRLRAFSAIQIARLASPAMSNCLRAALSLMRSYYSTPALLMYGNRDLDPWNRNGPLTEHADRLKRLIRISKTVAAARRAVRDALPAALLKDDVDRLMGPAPLYPDDLAWIMNELGVVRTTQGDLYTARPVLEEARRVNERFVDFAELHQNWRRISLNLVQVDIDCARIEQAEQRLRDIEDALEAEAKQFRAFGLIHPDGKSYATLRDYVVATYAHGPCSSIGDRIDAVYPTDLILGIALVLGYRGLCLHLRGALTPATEAFRDALAILERLNEQRAYAFFQQHNAMLLAAMGKLPKAIEGLRLCVAAAGPSRQTDIDHSGRIALAPHGILIPAVEEPKRSGPQSGIIPQLKATLRYATNSDMYRLQIEAMQYMALVHLSNGDADSAMQFATDALAIATRCGFGLRKVSLRILIGRILVFRSDRASGRKLLMSASRIATKLKYERAVETAEDALVQLGPD